MSSVTGADLDSVLAAHPAWHPPAAVLDLAELVVSGALAAMPRGLTPPEEVRARAEARGGLVLEDAEGTPVALAAPLSVDEHGGLVGPLAALRPFTAGPVRRHRRTAEQVRAALDATREATGTARVLAVPVDAALSTFGVEDAATLARHADAVLLWLVLVGAGRRKDLAPEPLVRAVRAAAADVEATGTPSLVVAVPAPSAQAVAGAGNLVDPHAEPRMIDEIARSFGASAVLPIRVRPEKGLPGSLHSASVREIERTLPPPSRRGVTVFFTGLSGSGKSTVAKALAERLLDDGQRSVSMLDGDEVRRLLSSGLGFSRADRDLNIRRIGFVAAEVTRHGGLAICAPIAPFAQVRAEVREMVRESGDFVLVHVSTPLAECERRDRKGLYAKARQGLIPEFTGISSPYEEPTDADLVLDTTDLPVADAVERVWALLAERGYLADDEPVAPHEVPAEAASADGSADEPAGTTGGVTAN
ncbi:MAG: adenylyl-sulfate kinase [Kineosporiaceae bacterium]